MRRGRAQEALDLVDEVLARLPDPHPVRAELEELRGKALAARD